MKNHLPSLLAAVLIPAALLAQPAADPDPELTVPVCRTPPAIDGKLAPGEWQYAAALGLFQAYPRPAVPRWEQPVFYVCRDAANLYIAMHSTQSTHEGIVARCSMHDNIGVTGDDAIEIMVGPGSREEANLADFMVFYHVINSLGTIWDCKFVPLRDEQHNSWESGAAIANGVDGETWVCEVAIPLANISGEPVKDGTVWRMNFARTYASYFYGAWVSGALNSAHVGGNVTFDSRAAAVRLLDVRDLVEGKFALGFEVANGTDREQTVTLSASCAGEPAKGETGGAAASDRRTATVAPGAVQKIRLGDGSPLAAVNAVELTAIDAAGRRLLALRREVRMPAPRFAKRPLPKVPLVAVAPRFLPSLERLAVGVDATAWTKRTGGSARELAADVVVFPKGQEQGQPALRGRLTDFQGNRGALRLSTEALPEGEYVVRVQVRRADGKVLVDYDDWFEKRIFDWMKQPRGVGPEVPELYAPLAVSNRTIALWGRRYAFGADGLPERVESQGQSLLLRPVELLAEVAGRAVAVETVEPFAVVSAEPARVVSRSRLAAGDLRLELECTTEYDGLMRYRLTYAPLEMDVSINRLRVKVPLTGRHARFYSASGDNVGTTVLGEVLPTTPGKVFDSLANTRSVCCSPTFASLFWTADYRTSFCYASDSDRGWLIRDDAPAVEAWREGEALVLWLNLVDKPWELKGPRTLEFAFQAGPTKALPAGWRGIQNEGSTNDAPLTFALMPSSGSGFTLHGGSHFMHPGTTPEQQRLSRERVEKAMAGGGKAFGGYHYWGHVPKGFPETRVFRGEWGISREEWEAADTPREWEWKNRFFGDNPDLCILMGVQCVPSYVAFCTYAYDECLKHTAICGFYDDTGYPKPVYDEELGLGFVREDGRKVYSSGLWIYRQRWQQAAYVNHVYKRPNFTWDSQHVNAHYMPAYNFIGIWAPCERGYYNPFPDRDNLEFYGSMKRYVARNPGRQFGQFSMIGMSSPWGPRTGKDPVKFARDTRVMMMLALLNDQDVGCFGQRHLPTVSHLRRARNVFQPWIEATQFTGYWENDDWVKSGQASVLVSLYHRPDGALFVIGNTGDEGVADTIVPAWKPLGLDPSRLVMQDAETGEAIAPVAGEAGVGFTLDVPRHDVRLVVAGPAGRYPVPPPARTTP